MTTILGAAAAAYKWDEGSLGSDRKPAKIKVAEAPQRLNQKVADIPGWRRINLDHTNDDHRSYRLRRKWVEVNGVEHKMVGIVGRPPNADKREMVAYIYDLSEDEIDDYSGEIYDPKRRIRPFDGKHSWLVIEGSASNTETVERNTINISQEPPESQEEG
jgi:hypothetical protein